MVHDFAGGENGASATVVELDSSHPDLIDIPDADLLSNATFERAGADLHLHGHSGQHVVIPGYFASAHHAALVAPNGERVSFDEIALLAGKHAAAQPANTANDAAPHAGPNAIGHVDKISGDVTVVRNGMSVTLHAGDAIYKNDVVQTGSGSSVAIALTDGTAINLVANTRMTLNEFSFDADSSSNQAMFTLLEGTFAFVAGKAAHGDMKIATPVGLMRIHEGTTGWAHELSAKEIASISTRLGKVTFSFAVVNSADSHGVYELLVKGAVIGDIGDPNLIWYLDQDGNLISMPLDHSQEFADGLPRDFLGWIETADLATKSLQGIHGSGSPIDPSLFPQAINLNQLGPTFEFTPLPGGSQFSVNLTHAIDDPNYIKLHSNIFIWNGFGNWDIQQQNWNQGFAPVDPLDIVIIQSGKSSYTANYSIASLTVNSGATLNIEAGALTVSGLTNAGLIRINSSGVDPALVMNGPIALTGHGVIEMLGPTAGNFILGNPGSNAQLVNVDNIIGGSGNIGDGDAQLTFVNDGTVVAKPILSADSGLLLINTGNAVQNFGVFEAVLKGELLIEDRLFNFGTVEAIGDGSSVVFDNNSATSGGNVPSNADGNAGLIQAIDGGTVVIKDSTIVNSGSGNGNIVDGLLLAGARSEILLQNATILEGFVSVEAGGEIDTVSGTTNRIDTTNGTRNATQPSIVNAGRILINDNATLILASPFDIDNSGTIELGSTGKTTLLEFNQPHAVLSGGGNVLLDGGQESSLPRNALNNLEGEGGGEGITPSQDIIDGLPGSGFATALLENRDNTISGAGAIGRGNGALAFQNDRQGTVDADLSRQILVIATGGNTIVNAGLFEASNGGELKIQSKLENSGDVIAHRQSEVRIEVDVLNEAAGTIEAAELFSRVDIVGAVDTHVSVDNFGAISARSGGTVSFRYTDIINEGGTRPAPAGSITADGSGALVFVEQSNVDNHGTVVAQNTGTVEFVDDEVTNEIDGLINATGGGSSVEFVRNQVENAGLILADQGGVLAFYQSHIDNDRVGTIEADGRGSKVRFEQDQVDNSGLIEAVQRGEVVFAKSHIGNRRDGTIEAARRDSEVLFVRDHVDNSGLIKAEGHGEVIFEKSHIDNDRHGTIEADGRGSRIEFDRDSVDNSGRIEAEHGGKVVIERSSIDNERRGIIEADGWGSQVAFKYDHVDNAGLIKAEHGGEISFFKSFIDNDDGGAIEANGEGAKITFTRDGVANWGFVDASRGGSILFDRSWVENAHDGEIVADGHGSDVAFKRDHVDNSGLIEAKRGGEVEFTRSHIDNARYATIEADGRGSKVAFDRDHVENSGRIAAEHRGEITFTRSDVDNHSHGTIEASGEGSQVRFERDRISNWGWIGATWGGEVAIDHSWVKNERGGEIEADGRGSEVSFSHDHVDNSGKIDAKHGGEVKFDQSHVDNHDRASIEANGRGSQVTFERARLDNWGDVGAISGGSVLLENSEVSNQRGGEIEADGRGSNVRFTYDHFDNSGRIEAEHGGEIGFSKSHIENDRHGIIESDGRASEISFDDTSVENWGSIRAAAGGAIDIDHSWIRNDGRIEAEHRGEVGFDRTHIDNDGTIKARHDSKVTIARSHVDNKDGLISAYGTGATIALDSSHVDGGTLTTTSGGVIQTVKGTSTFEDLTISAGSDVRVGGSTLELNGDIHELGTLTVSLHGELDLISATVDGGGTGALAIGALGTLDIEKGSSGTGATLDGVIVTNDGSVEVSEDTTLRIGNTVTLSGSGTLSMEEGSAISDNGSAATLDNSSTIAGQGTIGGDGLTLVNEASGVIDASLAGATLTLDSAIITNKGLLEATNGAALDIKSDVTNTGGRIEAHDDDNDDGSIVQLEAITVTGGTIAIDTASKLMIENGATVLNNVDLQIDGVIQIDAPDVTATLVLDGGSHLAGRSVKIGASGELDVNNAIFGKINIVDSGVFKLNGPLTLEGNFSLHIDAGAAFADHGVTTIADGKLVTVSASDAIFNEFDIGAGSTLELDKANALVVDFHSDHGKLVVDASSTFTGTVKGLSAGDVIDLAGVDVSNVVYDGTTVKVNDTGTSFTIAHDMPSDSTVAFRDDGNGGTELVVVKQLVSVSASPVAAVEGSTIPLNFSETLQGTASLTSVTINGIPPGATLSNTAGDALNVNGGSITLTQAQLAGLSITPANDLDFSLSIVANAVDADGYHYAAAATEAVTITPLAPSVSWAAGDRIFDAADQEAAIALDVGVNGDASYNSIASVVISNIQIGAVLTDGNYDFMATAGHTSVDVTGWSLADLTIRLASAGNFTLTATVTEKDSDNPAQTSTAHADLKVVTSTDWIVPAGGDWNTFADWDRGIPGTGLGASIDSSLVHATFDYVVSVTHADHASWLGLSDARATLSDAASLTIDGNVEVDAGTLKVLDQDSSHGAATLAAGSLAIHGGVVDVEGGSKSATDNGGFVTMQGGSLSVGGAIVVDGGKLLIEAGRDTTNGGDTEHNVRLPVATLNAASIDVETGGTVELDGTINVPQGTGQILVNGGNLIVGSTANFIGSSTLTFGANGGTITLEGDSNGSHVSALISGFGPGNKDVIDLPNVGYSPDMPFSVNYDRSTGMTTLSVGDEQVTLIGQYSAADFALSSDGMTNQDTGQQGTKILWGLADVRIDLSAAPPYNDPFGAITVTVTVLDPAGNAVQGVVVDPNFAGLNNPGQGAYDYFNHIAELTGDIGPRTTDSDGKATFTFQPHGFSGTYDLSVTVDGKETVTKEIVINPFQADAGRSSLTSMVRFAGPQETAVLTLADRDFLFNPRPGDAVTWTGNGPFSPGNGNPSSVTDIHGNLVTTFSPDGVNSTTPQAVSATFGAPGQQVTVHTTVNFVALDTWTNVNGGMLADGGNWQGGVAPDANHGAWIDAAGTVDTGFGDTTIYGVGTSATTTLQVDSNNANLFVTGYGDSVIAGALGVWGAGYLVVQHGQMDLNGAVTNYGNLYATAGGIINVAGNITGEGWLRVDGGQINVHGTFPASQKITIAGAGTIHLAQPGTSPVTFQGPGMLALDAAPPSGMTVSNFGLGDSIDLTNMAFTANLSFDWNSTTNTLTVHNGISSESIHFGEAHSAGDFALTADPLGSGGIDVVYKTPAPSYAGASSFVAVTFDRSHGNAMGGINNNGVAVIADAAGDYFFVNGHLVKLAGSPPVDPLGGAIGLDWASDINDNQTIVVSVASGGNLTPTTYTGTQDASTNLMTGAGGGSIPYVGPSQLGSVADHSGQGLGINNSNEVVGLFSDTTGGRSRQMTLLAPQGTLPPGAPKAPAPGYVHEYGFIYKPGIGYLTVDVGNSIANTGMSQFVPSQGATGFANTTSGTGYVADNHASNGGVAFTVLTSINDKGVAVGYYMDVHSVQHAFIFDSNDDSFSYIPDLHMPNGWTTSTIATGINDAGLVVGYYSAADGTGQWLNTDYPTSWLYGFVYDSKTGQFITTDFSVSGLGDHIALTGINNNGLVTGVLDNQFITANVNPVVTINDGGTLYVTAATNETINFAGPTGKLVLSAAFNGWITGFSGTAADEQHSDVIDLANINFVNFGNWFVHSYASMGVLTVGELANTSYTLNFIGYTGNFVLTSDGHGGTLIFDPPAGGETTIADGQLYLVAGADDGTITFEGHQGKLQLDDATHFTGTIKGFAGDAAHSDAIDLSGFDAASTVFSQKSVNGNLVVTATEGDKVATLTFDHVDGALNFADDGHGGVNITTSAVASGPEIGTVDATVTESGVHGTISAADPGASGPLTTSVKAEGASYVGEFSVHAATSANGTASVEFNFNFDPNTAPAQAVTQSYDVSVKEGATTVLHQTVSVSVATANADNFVFSAGVGADTIVNFDVQHDTIDLSHFENIQSLQQLSSMTISNAHGDAVIDLGNHDSLTIAGVTTAQLQQVMQNVVHLH
jgi:hypothetical protein